MESRGLVSGLVFLSLGLEGFRSRALRLETLHGLFFMTFSQKGVP